MTAFLDQWKTWFQSTMPTELDDTTILQHALGQFLESLGHLVDTDHQDYLLTTQVDITCPEKLSTEHNCVVHEVIKDLENLSLFGVIRDTVSNIDATVLKSAGLAESKVRGCSRLGVKFQCSMDIEVKPEHFLTMLLLSWPYVKCERQSVYGHRVLRAVTSQVVNSSPVLQNEVAQLRQQLQLVLDYSSSCTHCKMTGTCVFG